jgi:hypothetical protein
LSPRGRQRVAGGAPAWRLDQRLVLNQWMLSLFEVERFEQLADSLKDPAFEGFEDDGTTRFFHVIRARLFERQQVTDDALRAYDQNIARHWRAISQRRGRSGPVLVPKYFQYLALLFAEVYLDRCFRDPARLLADLNQYVDAFNIDPPLASRVPRFEEGGLNKLAFWMATGSGKTLLMHVNILQYRHYLRLHGRERELGRVILLTPNEGLSRQHLDELHASGLEAELFSKEGRGLFAGQAVEIIDVHKLREDMGTKTVAVDAFEGNNLVLVDEGHRGASGAEEGHWMRMRARLTEQGFSFEYSATFGQAVRASNRKELADDYARCILVDYSYRYFYRDGFGKDYRILNLADDTDSARRRLYLTACMLSYYQQLRFYLDRATELRPFLLERPLWVFVGGSVNALRVQGGRKVSDVIDVLLFLAELVGERSTTVALLNRLLSGKPGLLDPQGREVFANAFPYLATRGLSGEALFDDILRVVFNAASTASLHVEELKGADGELALRLGENEPFGVINVGDAPGLRKLCEDYQQLVVVDKEFAGSLFTFLSSPTSTVNLLIGSKKFTEGWNSWRVSTMGLMNIGRSEGAEVIQLFGRGVRLKGHGWSLKRSARLDGGIKAPQQTQLVETLGIFGVRADYMQQFKQFLEEEGLPSNEDRIEFFLPVLKTLGSVTLKTIRLKEGLDFKKNGPVPRLGPAPEMLRKRPLLLNWYPMVQAQQSRGLRAPSEVGEMHEAHLGPEHLAFLDWDEIYFELQRYKAERARHNFEMSKSALAELLAKGDWYTLLIPPQELEVGDFSRVRRWQEIAVTLLKKYCDRFYTFHKAAWEGEHLEIRDLSPDDPNFFEAYRLLVDQSADELITKLEELKSLVQSGAFKGLEYGTVAALWFSQHLYQPLLHIRGDTVEVSPVALNDGERDFVVDLRTAYDKKPMFLQGRELYLLRNLSRGRGVAFFEAGNFHPDFILWIVDGSRQYVTFVDPKGIRNLEGANDPKVRFYATIKELEAQLGDTDVHLASFIISNTYQKDVAWWVGDPIDFDACNVLFQKDEKSTYIAKMLQKILSTIPPGGS